MGGAQRHAQARLAATDGWIADGGDEETLFAEVLRDFHGFAFVADHDRNDRAAGFGCEKGVVTDFSCVTKLVDALPKSLAQVHAAIALQNFDCGSGSSSGGGNRCG